jgi:hypothetical protein
VTVVVGTILVTFLVIVYFAVPSELRVPTFFQRVVGIANAVLAMLFAMAAVREFGGRLNRVRAGGWGRISTSKVVGVLVFGAVMAWWLSPWAPIPPADRVDARGTNAPRPALL